MQTASLQQHLQRLHLQRQSESPPIARKLSPVSRASPPASISSLPVHPEEGESGHHPQPTTAALDVPERVTDSPTGRWTDSPGLPASPVLNTYIPTGRSCSPVLSRTLSASPTSGLTGSPNLHRRRGMSQGQVSPLVVHSRNGSQETMEETMDTNTVQFVQQVGSQSDGVLPTGVYDRGRSLTIEQSAHSTSTTTTTTSHGRAPRMILQGGSNYIGTLGGVGGLPQMSVPTAPFEPHSESIPTTTTATSIDTGQPINHQYPLPSSINQNTDNFLPVNLPSSTSSHHQHHHHHHHHPHHPVTHTLVNTSDFINRQQPAATQQPVFSAVPPEQRYPLPNLVSPGTFHYGTEGGGRPLHVVDDSELVHAMEESGSSMETSMSNSPIHHGKLWVL